MGPSTTGSDIDLPFGRTSTTVEELHSLVDIRTASSVLDQNGVDDTRQVIESFLEAVPDLLRWLEQHGRVYPWRETTDPWRVYISEILLQRTRADAVAQLYDQFFERYPHPDALRTAPDEEIRALIEPLGFGNQRTRTLRDVVQILGEGHDDQVPQSLSELKRPWRVGPYSARATLVFAFGHSMALVDTNFARVVKRVFDYEMPQQPHKSDAVYRLLDALVPDDPGLCRATNLGMLDLANAVCTPSEPDCRSCPLSECCLYADSE